MRASKKLIGGAIIGLAAGYVAGVLTAPSSGKDTRKKIKDTADKSIAEIEKQLKSVYKQSQEMIKKVLTDNHKINAKLQAALDAVEKSQAKIKRILSSLHGNDNVDEDLTQAISEAKQAMKHLGEFVKK
ncbi:MAG TPA: YtxH domain-containing protein [Candidatus Saccharimonadales bacterium]